MIIGNIRSAQDLSSKRNLQQQLLELEIANEAESERRMRDYKNPNKPIPIAPEYKTNSELQKDKIAQERQAIKNMEELGFDYGKSAELVAWLSSSLINKLVEFNANFKGIKKELLETTNPKLINLDFVKSYLEKYFEDIDINYGRKFSKDAMSGQLAPATIEELDNLLPQPADLERLETLLYNTEEEVIERSFRNLQAQVMNAKENIRDEKLPRYLEDELDERGKRDYRNKMKTYEKINEDGEKYLNFIYELIPKIRYSATLVELYSTIVPSNETLNLLKTGLTQKERGDVIRRYITILKSIQFFSKDGVEEITNEIGALSGRDIIDLDALNIAVNKLTKSLSFMAKEKAVDQITKLQRDIEVLMNQSGKLAEFEKMKSLNDLRERRMEEAKIAMRDSILEFDVRTMKRLGDISFRENEEITQDVKKNEIEREREIAAIIRAQNEQQIEQTKTGKELAGKQIKESFVGMFFDEPKIERPPLRYSHQLSGFQEVDDAISRIRKFQQDFITELRDMYNEKDPKPAIATARNFLIEMGAKGDKISESRNKTDKENFQKFLGVIANMGNAKIKRIIQDVKDKKYDIVDYDYIGNANRATKYLAKNVPSSEMTRYGIGLQKSLQQHFKEDEAELKNIAKSLRKHKAMEKKIDKYAQGEDSSSDDEAKGKGLPQFKHKKIKVGRGIKDAQRVSGVSPGIEVKKQPAYKTFGKYVIHMGHLLDKNVANFKYPSLGSIPSIKPMTISEDYKEFIMDTLENGKPNERNFNKLEDEEQRHFERVVLGAGLIDVFKLKRNHTERERKEAERFNLLRGEILAGNNSESVSKELRSLIVRFMNEGRIHQREGTTMLMELSSI
jgi:hypothetical protein